MIEAIINLAMFAAKSIIILALILFLFAGILSIVSRGREKLKEGRLVIDNLNDKFNNTKHGLLETLLTKKQFKGFLKKEKQKDKEKKKAEGDSPQKNIFLLNFDGDIRASAVEDLREEITAILNVANLQDEVVVRLDSAGGLVNTYGLAAAQLARIRDKKIPLTVCIDKVAASGGYLMACVANKIVSAPFSIVGSIGVLVQIPNFHRLLKENHIDFEQLSAGQYKRTLTLFGENTRSGRDKLKEEIEEVHKLFKNLITEYRPQIDIEKVATGEYWMGLQAFDLKLVDSIKTSDDYLLAQADSAQIYEISYERKKTLADKFSSTVGLLRQSIMGRLL